MKLLVAGASGFVGRRLCPALERAGHSVRAMTRHPGDYRGSGEPVRADVTDADSLLVAARGCDVAYYLVHSLDSASFEKDDAAAARAFGSAASEAGLRRIIYLGGLGRDDDELSPHLRSRRKVEELLGQAGVPVTTLRAGIIIGHGGTPRSLQAPSHQSQVSPYPQELHRSNYSPSFVVGCALVRARPGSIPILAVSLGPGRVLGLFARFAVPSA